MVYANPNGHDWGNNYNWDGLGISYVAFGVAYSILFYAMCAIAWAHRKHPVIKMRNIGLVIASLLFLHVFLFMVFLAYALNGHYPCDAEFWFMSFYLPLGIGLFQAQNQQLLLMSRVQTKMLLMEDIFKPLPPAGFGPKRWAFKLKQSWAQCTKERKYLCWVVVGIVVQFIVTAVIFFISRKFTSIGIVSQHVSKGMCRRGWEWAPSIIWQFVWNWILSPILLWKIRMIRDIYHWRLQTFLCVVAGLLGSPMWLLSAYHDGFARVNKYWVPAAWFVPGLMTMQLVTLGFPIYQVYRHKRVVNEIKRTAAYWQAYDDFNFTMGNSTSTARTDRKTMKGLEECLRGDHDRFLDYTCRVTYNGENVIFLLKVLRFKKQWDQVLGRGGSNIAQKRRKMYKAAVDIYISMVSNATAHFAINIPSPIYKQLEGLFGNAATLVASDRPATSGTSNRPITATSTTSQAICPWDEPPSNPSTDRVEQIEMMLFHTRASLDESSTRRILRRNEPVDPHDKLAGFNIPNGFSKDCFNNAEESIKYMVYTGPWQAYVKWEREEKEKEKENKAKGPGSR